MINFYLFDFLDTNMSLNLSSGIIVGVPIPEEHHVTGEEVENAIQVALGEAE